MLYLVGVYARSLEEAEGFYAQFRTTAYVSFAMGFVIEGGLSLMPEKDRLLLPWWNAVLRFFMSGIVKNLMLFDFYQAAQPNACYHLHSFAENSFHVGASASARGGLSPTIGPDVGYAVGAVTSMGASANANGVGVGDDDNDDMLEIGPFNCGRMYRDAEAISVLIIPLAFFSALDEYQKYAPNSDAVTVVYRKLLCHANMKKIHRVFLKLPLSISTMSGVFACMDSIIQLIVFSFYAGGGEVGGERNFDDELSVRIRVSIKLIAGLVGLYVGGRIEQQYQRQPHRYFSSKRRLFVFNETFHVVFFGLLSLAYVSPSGERAALVSFVVFITTLAAALAVHDEVYNKFTRAQLPPLEDEAELEADPKAIQLHSLTEPLLDQDENTAASDSGEEVVVDTREMVATTVLS